jgi:hypothetical protein
MAQAKTAPSPVQACITTIGFPKTFEQAASISKSSPLAARWKTDLEKLLSCGPQDPVDWTAPRWFDIGDILFFYHAANAPQNIAKLLEEAEQNQAYNHYIPVLKRAAGLAQQYAGCIFACAEVTGPTFYENGGQEGSHYRSRHYAPAKQVHIFSKPIRADDFRSITKINGQTALTLLDPKAFDGIKALLAQHNQLPVYLQQARVGIVDYQQVDSTNWRQIVCSPEARFNDEVYMRSYLTNYLLEELKDPGTTLLEECRCRRRGRQTGCVDYMIQLHGQWLPVEAKLNIQAERDLFAQVAKYQKINSFTPDIGVHARTPFSVRSRPGCLVIDQIGVYFVSGKEFVGCTTEKPL